MNSVNKSVTKAFRVKKGSRTKIVTSNGVEYQLLGVDGELPLDCIAVRQGDDLVIRFSDGTEVVLDGFFAVEAAVQLPSSPETFVSLPSAELASVQRPVLYAYGDGLKLMPLAEGDRAIEAYIERHFLGVESDGLVTNSISGNGGLAALVGIGAAAGGGGGGGNAGSSGGGSAVPTTPPTVVKLSVVAGPVNETLVVFVYDAKGNLLTTATTDQTGNASITMPSVNGQIYSGPILLRVADINPTNLKGYMDEASGAPKDLGSALRALTSVVAQQTTVVTITPLTEIAARKLLGENLPTETQPLTGALVTQSNQEVGREFGVADITGPVVPVIDGALNPDGTPKVHPDYKETDGISAAERYGQVLAMISGLDAVNGGSTLNSIKDLTAALSGDTSKGTIADLLLTGAKAFEFGTATGTSAVPSAGLATLLQTDGSGTGGATPTPSDRKLNAPVAVSAAKTALEWDSLTGQDSGELARQNSISRIDAKDALDGVAIPVALPAASIAGDILYLTFAAGTPREKVYQYTLQDADIAAGTHFFNISQAQLIDLGDGQHEVSAVVKSADASISTQPYRVPDATTLIEIALYSAVIDAIADDDWDGKPTVSGFALPNSTITVTWPDGTTSTTLAGTDGKWTAEAPTVQPATDAVRRLKIDSIAPDGTPGAPVEGEYAGIPGVSEVSFPAIVSALGALEATNSLPADATALRNVVDAYTLLLTHADFGAADSLPDPTAATYRAIGVTLPPTFDQNPSLLALLNDLVGTKDDAKVDSVSELQELAVFAEAIQTLASSERGSPIPQGIAAILTPEAFANAGIPNVTQGNLAAVLSGIAAASNDGSATLTVAQLQAVQGTAQAAISTISNYALANTGTVPTEETYTAAGVLGVSQANLAAINSALASLSVTGTSVDTTSKIQAVVTSFSKVLLVADAGAAGGAAPSELTKEDYTNIGLSPSAVAALEDPENLALLNDIISAASDSDVDTVSKVEALASIAIRIQAVATGQIASPALTVADFQRIGMLGVTEANLASVLEAIKTADQQAASTGGAAVDSLLELQARINTTSAVLTTIANFAETNVNPSLTGSPANYVGTAPTFQNYSTAGLASLVEGNVGTYNDALATAGINGAKADNLAALQTIVNAVNTIISAADGAATVTIPTISAQNYLDIGASIGNAATDPQNLKLLNDAIGRQTRSGVDTIVEIERLADTANRLQEIAAGADLAAVTAGLTPAQIVALLTEFGITGVDEGNYEAIANQIRKQADDGSATDTIEKLNAIVAATQTALDKIADFADTNTQSSDGSSGFAYAGTLSVGDFSDAGITGVTSGNLATIMDALATSSVGRSAVDDWDGIQAVVDAVNRLRAHADGDAGSQAVLPTSRFFTSPTLTKAEYVALGVGNATTGASTSFNVASLDDAEVLRLLNDAVGSKTFGAVDTVNEINNLARIAKAVQDIASGVAINSIVPSLTATDLTLLGISGVTSNNVATVLNAISTSDSGTPKTGSSADTLSELQAIAERAIAALDEIVSFASDNSIGEELPDDGNSSQYLGDATLTKDVFSAAGIRNVTDGNLRSIKDALASSSVTGAKVRATSDLQALVDSYNKIFALANGQNDNSSLPTVDDYARVGVKPTYIGSGQISPVTGLHDAETLSLLNDIIDRKGTSDIDVIEEINELARIAIAVQTVASGGLPTPALTPADFQKIGVVGVTQENLAAVLTQLSTAVDDGSVTSSLTDLQGLLDAVNYAPTNLIAVSTFTVNEDQPVSISGLQIADSDIGAGNLTVSLSAPNGVINVVASNGVNVAGNGTNSVSLTGSLAAINAILSANSSVTYTSANGWYGTETLTITTTDTTTILGESSKSDTDAIQINVVSVNDAPVGTDRTVTIAEDSAYYFAASDFGFSDKEGVKPANAFDRVEIASLPSSGVLKFNSTPVTVGQQIAVSDLGNLVFLPALNASGTNYASFGFKVVDNGGTANGGLSKDVVARTLTINVEAVPEIVGVDLDSSTGAVNGFLNAGDTVTAMVRFDQAIAVTGSGLNGPSIDLDVGGSTVRAYYDASKSDLPNGRLALTGTISANQSDVDGISVVGNSLRLNSGTILSALVGSRVASLEHAATASDNRFKVDAIPPAALAITGSLKRDMQDDTGVSSTDDLTSNSTPTFVGTVEAGSSVRVQVGGKTYDSTVPNSGLTVDTVGNWILTIPAGDALTDSTASTGVEKNAGTVYTLDISSIDVAGNVTTKSSAYSFTLDTVDPSGVAGGLASISDTGIAGDSVTSLVRPTLVGTAQKGSLVEVKIAVDTSIDPTGFLTYNTTSDASGNWTILIDRDLSGGAAAPFRRTFTYTVKSVDAAGNTTITPGTSFEVNTTDPTGSAALDRLSDTKGILSGTDTDNITSSQTPKIVGRIDPYTLGDEVRVLLDGKTYSSENGTAPARLITVQQDGSWYFVSEPLTAGDYMPSVSIKGYNANNFGTPLNGVGFRVDTGASVFGVSARLVVDADSNNDGAYDDNDSGAKGDNLTRDVTPTIGGTAEANSTVKITLKNTSNPSGGALHTDVVLSPVLVGPDGSWNTTVPSSLGDGTWVPVVIVNDLAGNDSSPVNGTAFVIDSTAPLATGISAILAAVSDTGNGAVGTSSDGKTNISTPMISGQAEPGSTVQVVLNGNKYTTLADSQTGGWTVQVFDALQSGTYTPLIRVIDKAGNVQEKSGAVIIVDLDAPVLSAVSAALEVGANTTNTGLNTDTITSVRNPVLRGTTENADDKVDVVISGVVYSASVQADRSWSVTVGGSNGLLSGTYTPIIRITDAAGNVASKDGTAFTIDYTAPAQTFISGSLVIDQDTDNDPSNDNDSGVKGDNRTRDTTPELSGTGEAHASVVLNLKDTTPGRNTPLADVIVTGVTVTPSGTWTAVVPQLGEGRWTAEIAMTDIAGNTQIKDATAFVIDTSAPTGTTGLLAASSDTGNGRSGSSADGRTNVPSPTIVGTAEAGATVDVTIGSVTYSTTANSTNGTWSIQASGLSDAAGGTEYRPSIKVTDSAGNSSTVLGTPFTLDLVAPLVSAISGALDSSVSSDSGGLGDNLTNVRLPRLVGTTEADTDKVEVIVNNKVYLATVSGTTWSVDVGGLDDLGAGLRNGTYTPVIRVTDAAGNTQIKDGTAFVVDYNPPAASGISGALGVDESISDNNVANDSGSKGDNLTRNRLPTLTGSGEPGSSVEVTFVGVAPDGITVLTSVGPTLSTNVDEHGKWTISAPSALADGRWTPSITIRDAAGNATTKNGTAFTVDRTAPVNPTGGLATASDTGNGIAATLADTITRNTTPVVTGVAERGATVEVSLNGKTYTTTANSTTGAWTVLVSDALPDTSANRQGTSYTPSIKITDAAGNVTQSNGTQFTLDAMSADTLSITGGLQGGGNLTTTTTPVLTGQVEASPNGIVTVAVGGKTYSSAVSGSGLILDTNTGLWTLAIPANQSLIAGSYTPQITFTDAAGNVAPTVDGTPFTVSISLRGELVHNPLNDTAGANTSGTTQDSLTKVRTPAFEGQAPLNSNIQIQLNGKTYSSDSTSPHFTAALQVDYATGLWTFSVPVADALPNGTYTWQITATDVNNPTAVFNVRGTPFTIDYSVPDAANITGGLAPSVDSGAKGDDRTNGNGELNVIFAGTGEVGGGVSLSFNGAQYTTTISNLGQWTITGPTFASLTNGQSYPVSVTVTDAAGNATNPIAVQTFTFDNSGPVFTQISISGTDGSGAAKSATLIAGDYLVVTAVANEKVNVVGRPSYALSLGNTTVQAVYDAEASATIDATGKTMVFKYTVRSNDLDLIGGITSSSGAITLGTNVSIRDDAYNNADLSSTGVPAASSNIVRVDAVAPTINGIEIFSSAGTDATYKADDKITFKVTFSEKVSFSDNGVGLSFLLGSTSVTAEYDPSQPNSDTQKYFTYVVKGSSAVASGDNDADGISIPANPLRITGSTTVIVDDAGNEARLSYSTVTPAQSAHMVDTTPPVVAITASTTAINAETGSSSSVITFTFSEDPGQSFTLSDVVAFAGSVPLVPGSDFTWTELVSTGTIRTARFTPKAGTTDTIVLSVANGTFNDVAGTLNTDGGDANNSLALAVDNVRPTVSLSIPATPTVWKGGDVVPVTLDFSEPVTGLTVSDLSVSGGAGTISNLVQVSPTRYTVDFRPVSGQAAGTNISINMGDAKFLDLAGNGNLDGNDPNNSVLVAIDTQVPTITNVEITSDAGPDKTYQAGNKITFRVTFSEAVSFSDNAVELNFRLGSSVVSATSDAENTALSATKTFSYEVKPEENDRDGISIARNPVSVVGATTAITDAAGNNASLVYSQTISDNPLHLVDTEAPTVQITREGTATIKAGTTETIRFVFSEDPGSTFDLSDVQVNGGNLTGLSSIIRNQTANNWYATATFTPNSNVASGTASISVSQLKFADAAGNLNDTSSNVLSFPIDTVRPTVVSITSSDDLLLNNNGVIESTTLEFTFSEEPFGFGQTDIVAFNSVTGAEVDPNDFGSFGPVTGNGATRSVVFTAYDKKATEIRFGVRQDSFTDAAGNVVAVDAASPVRSEPVEIATNPPSVESVNISKVDNTTSNNTGFNGALVEGDVIQIAVSYTSPVKLTAGTPSFQFVVGGLLRTASLVTDAALSTALAPNGGATLMFRYEVPKNIGQSSLVDGLVSANSGALRVENVTIVSAAEGATANSATPAALLAPLNALEVRLDNSLPTVAISIDDGVTQIDFDDATPVIRFVFSEPRSTFVASSVSVSHGSISTPIVVAGTDGKVWTANYLPPVGQNALDRTNVTVSIGNGAFYDEAGNANNDGAEINNSVRLVVDNRLPTLSGIVVSSVANTSGIYNTGDVISFSASFTEVVFASGFAPNAPYVEFTMGTETRRAYLATGSGTTTLVFNYVVQVGDVDADGISFGQNPVRLNSQTITDQIGNNAVLTAGALPTSGAHKVDTTLPTVTLSVPSGDTALQAGETVDIKVVLSEPIDGSVTDALFSITGSGSVANIRLDTNDPSGLSYLATYTPAPNVASAVVTINAKAGGLVDLAGNASVISNAISFTVDTLAPAAVSLALNQDTFSSIDTINQGSQQVDRITSNTALTPGSVEATATVLYRVTGPGGAILQVAGSDWITSAQYTQLMSSSAEGQYTVNAVQIDAAGNRGPETGTISFTKDTIASNNLVLGLLNDTLGSNAVVGGGSFGTGTDKITSVASFSASGAESGAIIQYKSGNSGWVTDYSSIVYATDGDKVIEVRQIDRAGNISDAQIFTFTLDRTAPTLTSISGRLADSEDTGSNTNDRRTNASGGNNANSVTLVGVSEAGTYVKVVVRNSSNAITGTYAATSNPTTGEWTLDIPKADLPDGGTSAAYTYDIISVDLAGNITTRAASTFALQSFVVDYTAPSGNLSGQLDAGSDTGNGLTGTLSDHRTSNATPTLRGLAEANARVEVTIAGITYSTFADGTGAWTLKVETPLVDDSGAGSSPTDTRGKTFNYKVKAIDAAGNQHEIDGTPFVLDTVKPTTGLITGSLVSDQTSDTGLSDSDDITRNRIPELEGTAEANSKVEVTVGGVTYTTQATAAGQWKVAISSLLPEGRVIPSIRVTDAAGNVQVVEGTPFTVDITNPTAPTISSTSITNDTSPLISGRGEAGSIIDVRVGTIGLFRTTVTPSGTWSVDTGLETNLVTNTQGMTLAAGSFSIVATARDTAGNSSTSVQQTLTIDTTPPSGVVIPTPTVLGDPTPVIAGTGEPGATVKLTVTVDGVPYEFSTFVGPDGRWSVDTQVDRAVSPTTGTTLLFPTNLTTGSSLQLSAVQIDAAGNTQTAASAQQTVSIDLTRPTISQVLNEQGEPGLGFATNDSSPIIRGTAAANSTVSVSITGQNNTTVTYSGVAVDGAGNWSINTQTASPSSGNFGNIQVGHGGIYLVAVTDGANNIATQAIVVDLVNPSVAFSTLPVSQDDVVNIDELNGLGAGSLLTGTAEISTSVTISFANATGGGTTHRQATLKADGTWEYQLTQDDIALIGQSARSSSGPVADRVFTATSKDKAGNTQTATKTIAIDTIRPTLDLNAADALSQNWAIPLTQSNFEYSLDNGSDVNLTAARISEFNTVNKITVHIDPSSLRNGTDEFILIGDTALSANGLGVPSSVAFGGVNWLLQYADNTFSFVASTTPSNSSPAQAFIRNLRYINKAAVLDLTADRVFKINVYDTAGNKSDDVISTITSDTVGPIIDLNGVSSGFDLRKVATTSAELLSGVSVGSQVTVSEQNAVARIVVKVEGLMDGGDEKLRLGDVDLNANGTSLPSTVSVNGVSIGVSYDSTSSSFRFVRQGGGALTPVEAAQMIAALTYKNTAASPTSGFRKFTISAVDSVNNVTGSPVEFTVGMVDPQPTAAAILPAQFTAASSTAPAQNTNGRITTYDADGDGVLGDQFQIKFSELVATSAIKNVSNWSLSTGQLGAGATITAVDPVVLRNADGTTTEYASKFLFISGVGKTYTSATVLTIAQEHVVGTGGAAQDGAQANISFAMTDIDAPAAPTWSSATYVGDNIVSSGESGTLVVYHAALASGDRIRLFRDGVDITNASGVSLVTDALPSAVGTFPAGTPRTTFTLTNAAWGAEGLHSFAVRIVDASGNNGSFSPPKPISVDAGLPNGVENSVLITDAGTAGASVGDVVRLTFREPVRLRDVDLSSMFGTGATVRAVAPQDGARVINGTLHGNTQFWTATAAAAPGAKVPTVISGTQWVTFYNDDTTQGGKLSQTITTVVGETYTVTYDQTGAAGLSISATGGATVTNSATGSYTYTFTATSTNTILTFTDVTASLAPNVLLDTIRIRGGELSTQWDVTLGSGVSTSFGGASADTAISIANVRDSAGNTGTVTGVVAAGLYDKPTSITIGNVTADNVISGTERENRSISVALTGARSGDVIKLYMDGRLVGSSTLATAATSTTVTLDSNVTWGADGLKNLVATIERGSTKLTSLARSVEVVADGTHWSAAQGFQVLWFDPNTLSSLSNGDVVSSFASSAAGGQTITLSALAQAGGADRPMRMIIDQTGNRVLVADSTSGLRSAQSWLPTTAQGFTDFSLVKFSALPAWWSYSFTHAFSVSSDNSLSRTHFGAQVNSANIVFQQAGDLGGAVAGNAVTLNNWMQLLGVVDSTKLSLGTAATTSVSTPMVSGNSYSQAWPNGGVVIGGTAANTSFQQGTPASLGDQISVSGTVRQAYREEISTYQAIKYQTIGTRIAPSISAATLNGTGGTYDLSVSGNESQLIDDVLILNNESGLGKDMVTVDGRDYVMTGWGNDTVLAKDLSFVTLDGAGGFDTFVLHSSVVANSLVLADYVSNARGTSGDTTADNRVNASGFHKLLGFERLDFAQNTARQVVTVSAQDVDQLAGKNVETDPQRAANTSNLYVQLSSNDYLLRQGFGDADYGYWLDASGVVYDRRYSATGGTIGASDTATIYVRGGDDAPDFGSTATVASYKATSVSFDFNEALTATSLSASDFTINGVTASSVALRPGGSGLDIEGSVTLSGVVRVQYSGSALVDTNGDQLRFKDMSIGSSFSDTMDGSGRSANQALFGGAGGDTITGGSGDDILLGMAGNDRLTGGSGGDIFRFIQFESGTDTITDFTKVDGDKIDLRGILMDSGFDSANLSNIESYISLTRSGNDALLRIDDQGIGNFVQPGQTINLLGAASGTQNLFDGASMITLQTLIDQRVILV